MHSFPLKHDFAPTKCMDCLEQLLAHGRHLQVNAVKNNFLLNLNKVEINYSIIHFKLELQGQSIRYSNSPSLNKTKTEHTKYVLTILKLNTNILILWI